MASIIKLHALNYHSATFCRYVGGRSSKPCSNCCFILHSKSIDLGLWNIWLFWSMLWRRACSQRIWMSVWLSFQSWHGNQKNHIRHEELWQLYKLYIHISTCFRTILSSFKHPGLFMSSFRLLASPRQVSQWVPLGRRARPTIRPWFSPPAPWRGTWAPWPMAPTRAPWTPRRPHRRAPPSQHPENSTMFSHLFQEHVQWCANVSTCPLSPLFHIVSFWSQFEGVQIRMSQIACAILQLLQTDVLCRLSIHWILLVRVSQSPLSWDSLASAGLVLALALAFGFLECFGTSSIVRLGREGRSVFCRFFQAALRLDGNQGPQSSCRGVFSALGGAVCVTGFVTAFLAAFLDATFFDAACDARDACGARDALAACARVCLCTGRDMRGASSSERGRSGSESEFHTPSSRSPGRRRAERLPVAPVAVARVPRMACGRRGASNSSCDWHHQKAITTCCCMNRENVWKCVTPVSSGI